MTAISATPNQGLMTKTLLYHLWQEFRTRYRFKYVLPRIREIELEGLKFDVSSLSPKIRNRLLSGAYEAYEKKMCFDYLTPNDSVLEIGGAIGFIGLICQKRIGIREYTCFEANPRTCEILKENYRLNGVQPRVCHMALAETDGEVDLEVGSDFWENSICARGNAAEGSKTTRVPAGTLTTLFRIAGQQPNVLIIDIEGAEQFIDFGTLPAQVNKIIIELHPKVLGPEKTYETIAALILRGFRVARQEEDTFVFLRK